MGRNYAGILGFLAFATVIARGVVGELDTVSTMALAVGCLFVFAIVGWTVGAVAEQTIIESVRYRFRVELETENTGTES
jgi:hypothetical protein